MNLGWWPNLIFLDSPFFLGQKAKGTTENTENTDTKDAKDAK